MLNFFWWTFLFLLDVGDINVSGSVKTENMKKKKVGRKMLVLLDPSYNSVKDW